VRDFEPIIIGATSPEVLVVHPSVPAKTVQELVALVRAGQYNNFAIAGAGTPPHLSTELFKLSLKLDIVTVPFGGGGPMVQSVVGGHTPVAFATLPSALFFTRAAQGTKLIAPRLLWLFSGPSLGLNRRPARRRLALPEKRREETHHGRRVAF
jgi:tripartite-type tricarboxylate transporter receptor subunit TctC